VYCLPEIIENPAIVGSIDKESELREITFCIKGSR